MNHIAIMNKSLGLIPDIVSGKKTIESRWYVHRFKPWNTVQKNDVIYFKDSGKPITAKAVVDRVLQFENLDKSLFKDIVDKYADGINMVDRNYSDYYKRKNFVILIFLKDAEYIPSFEIDKSGFGSGCAWMCLGNKNPAPSL